jgi:four helix bundle protein
MDFRELLAYKKAFDLAMEIYELSKSFPLEEKYSLTDQIRRSSRSVCANIAESYRKRRFVNHFISKLTDNDSENSETYVWLEFAFECNYITKEIYQKLSAKNIEIGKLINYMINNPDKFWSQLKTITATVN